MPTCFHCKCFLLFKNAFIWLITMSIEKTNRRKSSHFNRIPHKKEFRVRAKDFPMQDLVR